MTESNKFFTIKEHLDSASSVCTTFCVPLADIPALWRIGTKKALRPFCSKPDFKHDSVQMNILPDILKAGEFSLNHVQVTGDANRNYKVSFFYQKIGTVIRPQTFGDLLQAERLAVSLSNGRYQLHVYLDTAEVRFHCKYRQQS